MYSLVIVDIYLSWRNNLFSPWDSSLHRALSRRGFNADARSKMYGLHVNTWHLGTFWLVGTSRLRTQYLVRWHAVASAYM